MYRGDLFSVRTDISNMEKRMNRYVTELGMGEKEVLLTQGRLLAKDISDASPPKSLAKAKERANKQVARTFYVPRGGKSFFDGNSTKAGRGETQWLYAGGVSGANFVAGIPRELMEGTKTYEEMRKIMAQVPKGSKWERRTNDRGAHVVILKRQLISRTMSQRLAKGIQDRFGRLKGSWVKAAKDNGCPFDTFVWVQKHVPNAKGQGIPQLEPNNPQKSLTFVSRADGVQSEASWKAIRGGIHGRAQKMAVDLRNIERGAYKRAGFALAQ